MERNELSSDSPSVGDLSLHATVEDKATSPGNNGCFDAISRCTDLEDSTTLASSHVGSSSAVSVASFASCAKEKGGRERHWSKRSLSSVTNSVARGFRRQSSGPSRIAVSSTEDWTKSTSRQPRASQRRRSLSNCRTVLNVSRTFRQVVQPGPLTVPPEDQPWESEAEVEEALRAAFAKRAIRRENEAAAAADAVRRAELDRANERWRRGRVARIIIVEDDGSDTPGIFGSMEQGVVDALAEKNHGRRILGRPAGFSESCIQPISAG